VNALSAEYDAKRFDATDIADSPNKSPRSPGAQRRSSRRARRRTAAVKDDHAQTVGNGGEEGVVVVIVVLILVSDALFGPR